MKADDILLAALQAASPERLPQQHLDALAAFKQEVINFLQQRFPGGHGNLGAPRSIGSQAKGTDIGPGLDIDLLVPFKHGYQKDAKALRAFLRKTLRKQYPHPPTHVRDQRVSVGLIRHLYGQELRVDIVPGLERSPGDYFDQSADPARTFLLLYDREQDCERPTNVDEQHRLLARDMPHYRDTVRLLKLWCHKERHKISSYALELLVYRAATLTDAPTSGSPSTLLAHVLAASIDFLQSDGALQDIGAQYPWPDYLRPGGKRQLARRWKKLLEALDDSECRHLPDFFQEEPPSTTPLILPT
jgi:hypothetical protein